MYVPTHHIDPNDNDRIVFTTSIMEYVDAFRLFDDVYDYRFMFEYNERGAKRRNILSYNNRLLIDTRWKAMIRELNTFFVDLFARIVVINGHDHIVINDRIVTLYGEDEIHIGYDGAVEEFISYLKDTDIELFGGKIADAQSCVNSINQFVNVIRAMNQ